MSSLSLHDSLYGSPPLLNAVHNSLVTAIFLASGMALSMLLFIIPIIQLGPTTQTKITQFTHMVTLGARYLQTTSRVAALTTLSLATLFFNHPDSRLAPRWRLYAAALGVLVPIAPYETLLIFPINDRLSLELDAELKRSGKKQGDFGDGRDQEVERLLGRWSMWHVGRFALATSAAVLLLWAGPP